MEDEVLFGGGCYNCKMCGGIVVGSDEHICPRDLPKAEHGEAERSAYTQLDDVRELLNAIDAEYLKSPQDWRPENMIRFIHNIIYKKGV